MDLTGQIIVSMPTLQDERFYKTVIYMCAHSKEGSMGIIINKKIDYDLYPDLLKQLGIDQQGQWMGFALGDYDGDADLDVFVTNMGFHPLTREWPGVPSADCAYYHQTDLGTCFHALIENRVNEGRNPNRAGAFAIVTKSIRVTASPAVPPQSLDDDFEDEKKIKIVGREYY